MKLCDKYKPERLADVVGQPPARAMMRLVASPHPCCLLLEGPPGTGKTSAARALANELGCECEWSGLHRVVSVDLSIDAARELFGRNVRLRPMMGAGWHVVIVEELEACSSVAVQRYLKVALEELPGKCVVVATSNGAGGLDKALLQRFRVLSFSGGVSFLQGARERLAWIWKQEAGGGVGMPAESMSWGVDRDGEFSMRAALADMENWLAMREREVVCL